MKQIKGKEPLGSLYVYAIGRGISPPTVSLGGRERKRSWGRNLRERVSECLFTLAVEEVER